MEIKYDNSFVFPFYLRRAVYFIDMFFKPMGRVRVFKIMRNIKTRIGCICYDNGDCHHPENDLKSLMISGHKFDQDTAIDHFFNSTLGRFRMAKICNALQNLDKYQDIEFPTTFKLLDRITNYLEHVPHTIEQQQQEWLDTIYKRHEK